MTKDAEAGFTLTELLVSLAILGMMAATLLSGLVTGRRVWERVETKTGELEQVAAAQGVLRDMIERIYPQGRLGGSQPSVDFAGDARGFAFYAPAADALGPSSPWRYRIGLSQTGALTLYAQDTLAWPPERPGTSRALIGDVAGADFAYFGRTDFDAQPRWRNRWRAQPKLPDAIRVRLRFAGSDRRLWPDLIAHPATTVDTLCVYVVSTGRCRGR